MANSPNLDLPRLEAGQASAEVTHNEAINILDTLVFLAVVSAGDTTPPGSPSNGDSYLVGASATGDWGGEDGNIAMYYDGWVFKTPAEGWIMRVADDDQLLQYDGTDWQRLKTGGDAKQVVIRIESPNSSDEVPLMYTNVDITITSVRSVRSGGTSLTWNIRHGTSRAVASNDVFSSNQTTTSTTTGDVDSSGFDDATIPAGSFVWWDYVSESGTVTWIELFIDYTEDAPQ